MAEQTITRAELIEKLRYYGEVTPDCEDNPTRRYMRMGANMLETLGQEADWKPEFDLVAHLYRQRAFSERTFGPGPRTAGVLAHISKELEEIKEKPDDVSEWVDVILLALDGAWRAGFFPEQIVQAIADKQAKNEARKWPDWRTVPADAAIEHDRSGEDGKDAERMNRDQLFESLKGLHKVCEIALAGKDGEQHTYFETRAGHFVEASHAMQEAEAALSAANKEADHV